MQTTRFLKKMRIIYYTEPHTTYYEITTSRGEQCNNLFTFSPSTKSLTLIR